MIGIKEFRLREKLAQELKALQERKFEELSAVR